MTKTFRINGIRYDLDNPIDISIPLRFNGPQPNAYGVEPARSEPVKAGDLIGDTRLGGSVNFETYTFIPHCNGTHTECVGHITNERISVRECLKDVFIPAVLVSVSPEWAGGSEDLVITREAIESALMSEPGAIATGFLSGTSASTTHPETTPSADHPATTPSAEAAATPIKTGGEIASAPLLKTGGELEALIIRTLPNDESKLAREYGEGYVPPYFSTDAMEYIVNSGFKHLLVDLPSIDRIFDEGKLKNHRIFWNVDEESFDVNENSRVNSTITELIYVPNTVEDGTYLLNLQIAPFESDCSPSRPILWPLI